jgi:hypothetical protein
VTAKRYTAVFTGLFGGKKPGEYLYLSMGDSSESSVLRRGRPPGERLTREISFDDLPEDCRRIVLDTYLVLWDL